MPPVIKNLIIINVLLFAATYLLQKAQIINLDYYLGLFHWSSPLFRPWQLVTHIFMHGNLTHLFFNMFALWMFGNLIENTLGPRKFLIFYFVCGLGAALCHLAVFSWENADSITWFRQFSHIEQSQMIDHILATDMGDPRAFPMVNPMVGASGAIFGILFAFGYLFPNLMIYIYFLFPIRAKYFVAIYAAIELFAGFRNSPTDRVAHFAHLGGMLFAYFLLKAWRMRSRNVYY